LKIDRLYDCSPVFQAAYEDTSVSKRKLDDIKATDDKLEALRKEIEERWLRAFGTAEKVESGESITDLYDSIARKPI
jgi:hypothetical protein